MPLRSLNILAVLAVAATPFGCESSAPPPAAPPAATTKTAPADAYAGKTEVAVRATLGKPSREFAGHYGNPPTDFTDRFTGEVKTLVFKDSDGETYASFEKRGVGWVCICSSWLPHGSAF
jgi:hypothetical protein